MEKIEKMIFYTLLERVLFLSNDDSSELTILMKLRQIISSKIKIDKDLRKFCVVLWCDGWASQEQRLLIIEKQNELQKIIGLDKNTILDTIFKLEKLAKL